jgi:hypothetical protein
MASLRAIIAAYVRECQARARKERAWLGAKLGKSLALVYPHAGARDAAVMLEFKR